jgi:two-component system, OmpR family, response regulator MprA
MGSRVLIVDDDRAVLSGLKRAFALADYEVFAADCGEDALAIAEQSDPDLIVLDILLPGLDGFTVCERLRGKSKTPILLLSAKDAVPDRVMGLDKGADDYLVKPFSVDELLARARALLRRSTVASATVLQFGDLSLDVAAREASRGGKKLLLTFHEFELLATFMKHPKQALSRTQLCQQVWGYTYERESNFVDVAVMELRKKLERDDGSRQIQTLRGVGYMLGEP